MDLERIALALERIATSLEKQTSSRTISPEKSKFQFQSIWAKYPNKLGRKQAERHFNSSVLNEKDYSDIQIAISNYLRSERVLKGFIQNGSTWFNNWRDWIDYKEEKKYESNDAKLLAQIRGEK